MSEANKVWRIIDGEALVLDLQGGAYYSLNPVGTAILKGLVEGKSHDSIQQSLQQTFPGAPPDTSQDLERFVGELGAADLLGLQPAAAEEEDEDGLGELVYTSPKMHRYDQFSQVLSYSPDEL